MIDMPQAPPPAYEQTLTQKLVQCGLRPAGFTVRYEPELQSVEIVIGKGSGATVERAECIRQAAGSDIVTIDDPAVRQAYHDRVADAVRPAVLAHARAALERRGVLKDFPERSAFTSDRQFGEALERQCGMTPGSAFAESRSGLILQPSAINVSEQDKLTCLLEGVHYAIARGDRFTFGIIGNEQIAAHPAGAVAGTKER